jgi:hypothetical protein
MRRARLASLLAAALPLLVASACSGGTDPEATRTPSTQAPATTEREATVEEPAVERVYEEFHRDEFGRSTVIDNEWFPLRPGTQFVWTGSTFEGGRRVPHRVVFTVTDLTKVIAGVRTVVAWDRDYGAGELLETEIAFFAQDDDGTVWHFGQYPEEYERGKFVAAPAWIAGFQNARAGITMHADPQLGTPSYSEGWGPAVNWTDRAQVYRTGRRTCVPVACYDDVLVVEEFSRDEPDAFQLKYYARGVGNVRVGWRGDDQSREILRLVRVVHLGPDALSSVRRQVLALERRAYTISTDVYGRTEPATASR